MPTFSALKFFTRAVERGSVGVGVEQQLEQLLDELNSTLRPRIERPVRQRPLLAVGVALGVGVLIGSLLSGGRRS